MGVKLLIADDEDSIRLGICKYIQLHTERFERIYMAENGEEALELIIRYRPDIMLLDVRMPLKNGIEVMQEAARLGILPATVILSGYDEFTYAQQAVRCGARDYLLKPVRSSDILAYVNQLADELFGIRQPVVEAKENVPLVISQAEAYIREHYNEDISAGQIADYVGITAGYLSTLFAQHCHCGISERINDIRIDRACIYLKQSYLKSYEIAYKVGFRDEKYFSKVFKKKVGISPAEYRKSRQGGAGTCVL